MQRNQMILKHFTDERSWTETVYYSCKNPIHHAFHEYYILCCLVNKISQNESEMKGNKRNI